MPTILPLRRLAVADHRRADHRPQVGLASPWLDGSDAYWTESRPLEGGRVTLIRAAATGLRSS